MRYELRYFRLVRYEQLLASKHAPRWQRAGAADARSSTTKKLHYHTQHPRLDSMEGWRACIDITMQHEPQPEKNIPPPGLEPGSPGRGPSILAS